eukprot:TRINITY_DN54568_c0_g1_i1.p1 TRINITY_DN54568_c0_g1~~TRINITY_DN54568_c0_g1_i1.p1  ORF type:complete len:496 (+),score=76.42 TRINITY_DN54568_c0_g1_i1:47-1489(+)
MRSLCLLFSFVAVSLAIDSSTCSPQLAYNDLRCRTLDYAVSDIAREPYGWLYFRVQQSPYEGLKWLELAASIASTISKMSPKQLEDLVSRRLLEEALAAFDVARLLHEPLVADQLGEFLDLLEEHGVSADVCEPDPDDVWIWECLRLRRDRRLVNLVLGNDYAQAAQSACSTIARPDLELRLSQTELRTGVLTAVTMRRALVGFRACGILALHDVFPPLLLTEIAKDRNHTFSEFRRKGSAQRDSAPKSADFTPTKYPPPIFQYETGRYHLDLPLLPPYTCRNLVARHHIFMFVQTVLGHNIHIDDYNTILTTRKAPSQQDWNSEHKPLFGDFAVSHAIQLPAHGVSLIVSLENRTIDSGALEFLLGSHLQPLVRQGSILSRFGPAATFSLPPRSALLFDTRLLRRFLATSGNRQLLIHLNYVTHWYGGSSATMYDDEGSFGGECIREPYDVAALFTRKDRAVFVRHLQGGKPAILASAP